MNARDKAMAALAVFEDPEDGHIGGVKLSVAGGSYDDMGAAKVHYQPRSNWIGGAEGHSYLHDDWRSGPVVESLLDLAKRIREKEAYDQSVNASIPVHLP